MVDVFILGQAYEIFFGISLLRKQASLPRLLRGSCAYNYIKWVAYKNAICNKNMYRFFNVSFLRCINNLLLNVVLFIFSLFVNLKSNMSAHYKYFSFA